MNKILEQLWDIYTQKETWHTVYLTKPAFEKYTEKLMRDKNIVVYAENGKVLGYFEAWKINYDQLERIVTSSFEPGAENITDGHHCYVANIYIDKESRFNKNIWREFKKQFDLITSGCVTVSGHKVKHNKNFILHTKRF